MSTTFNRDDSDVSDGVSKWHNFVPPEVAGIPGEKKKSTSFSGGLHRLGKNYRPDLGAKVPSKSLKAKLPARPTRKLSYSVEAKPNSIPLRRNHSQIDKSYSNPSKNDSTSSSSYSGSSHVHSAWHSVSESIKQNNDKKLQELDRIRQAAAEIEVERTFTVINNDVKKLSIEQDYNTRRNCQNDSWDRASYKNFDENSSYTQKRQSEFTGRSKWDGGVSVYDEKEIYSEEVSEVLKSKNIQQRSNYIENQSQEMADQTWGNYIQERKESQRSLPDSTFYSGEEQLRVNSENIRDFHNPRKFSNAPSLPDHQPLISRSPWDGGVTLAPNDKDKEAEMYNSLASRREIEKEDPHETFSTAESSKANTNGHFSETPKREGSSLGADPNNKGQLLFSITLTIDNVKVGPYEVFSKDNPEDICYRICQEHKVEREAYYQMARVVSDFFSNQYI